METIESIIEDIASFYGVSIDDIKIESRIKPKIKTKMYNMSRLKINEIISEAFMITPDRLMEKTRQRDVVDARHFAIWFYFKKMHMSNNSVARKFQQHHATVIHAVNKVESLHDKDFAYKSRRAIRMLTEAGVYDPELEEAIC